MSADVTKCLGNGCQRRDSCKRFTTPKATAHQRQWWFVEGMACQPEASTQAPAWEHFISNNKE